LGTTFISAAVGTAYAARKAFAATFSNEILSYMNSGGSVIPYASVPGAVRQAAFDAAVDAGVAAGGEALRDDLKRDASVFFGEKVFSAIGIVEPGNYYAEKIIDIANETSEQLHETIEFMQNRYEKYQSMYEENKCTN
jgi:hypothetical protein